jgi:hypothetical protein
MTDAEKVEYLFDTIRHYLLDEGSDLHVNENEAELINDYLPQYFDIDYVGKHAVRPFALNRNDLEFPVILYALLYKKLYNEQVEVYDKLYEAVSQIHREF